MKKSILITGMSGTGKSTLGKGLRKLGFSVHDIENIPGMFTTTDTRTNEVLTEWDTNNVEQIQNLFFACNKEKLAELISREESKLAFYCGTATNIKDIIPLFNKVVLLQATPEKIRYRLSTRTTHDFAKISEMQDWIIKIKDQFENELINEGAIVVEANDDINTTISKVLTVCGMWLLLGKVYTP